MASENHPTQSIAQVESLVKKRLGALVEGATLFRDQLTLHVHRDKCLKALHLLKEDAELGFGYLVDMIGQERMKIVQADRFEVIYILHSNLLGKRIRVKTTVPESDPVLPTASGIWKAANWFEREVFDMMGVQFEGHPDLRRILTWDGFTGHPLRKDFPFRPKEEVSFWQRTPDGVSMMTGGRESDSLAPPNAKLAEESKEDGSESE